MMKFEAQKIAEKIEHKITHKELDTLFNDLKITSDIPVNTKKDENNGRYIISMKNRIVNMLLCENDEKVKQFLHIIKTYYPNIELQNEYRKNNITNDKHFDNQELQMRYEELVKAVNNNMPLSFFWLAGSIIEGILCEYCNKNNIKSSKDDIDGYINALKNNKTISEGSIIYITLQHFRLFRNTIHPHNQNNDFIKDKNL